MAVACEIDEDLEESVPVGSNARKVFGNSALNRDAGIRQRRLHEYAQVIEDCGKLHGSHIVFGGRNQLERSKSLQSLHEHP